MSGTKYPGRKIEDVVGDQRRAFWASNKRSATFDEVWKAIGYRYGEEALEQVRFGWNLAVMAGGTELARTEQDEPK